MTEKIKQIKLHRQGGGSNSTRQNNPSPGKKQSLGHLKCIFLKIELTGEAKPCATCAPILDKRKPDFCEFSFSFTPLDIPNCCCC